MRLAVCAVALLIASTAAAVVSRAQGATQGGGRFLATRGELETQSRAADSLRRPAQAATIRDRLSTGDFQEGDRIVVSFQNGPDTAVTDTLTVRRGPLLSIPPFGDVSLAGVLRSEAQAAIATHLLKHFKDPGARATPLIRIAVQGSVLQPGWKYASADAPLSDVLMLAGGQAGDADAKKVVVRRAGIVIWEPDDLQSALAEGLTVDRLRMSPGDEVFVPQKSSRNWGTIFQVTLSVVTLVLALTRS